MNDQQQPYGPYDPYYGGPRIVGYDEYGRPVYEQPGQGQDPQHGGGPQQGYDPYGQQGYGQDPYAQPQQAPRQHPGNPAPEQAAYDPYGQQGYGYDTGAQPVVADPARQQPAGADGTQQWSIPQQQASQQHARAAQEAPAADPMTDTGERPAVPGQRSAPERDYRTEQFAFVEDGPDEAPEDVIDWLNFTESRSERREEAKRRGRRRVVALVVVLALAVVGGAGYLWYAGGLPGVEAPAEKQGAAAGPQKRDVIVVHLHDTDDKDTSTALLVNNETSGQGSTVLLPNSLAVSNDDGTATTLGKSVDDDGSDGTRESIGNLLGTKVAGTWRLDTPYLENLVDLVGNIDVDTDTDVPDKKKGATPLVHRGKDQTLSGQAAIAYATYHAPGEAGDRQLARFGQVLQATLRKISDDPAAATVTVQTLAQILDPSLTDRDLGTALAKLARHAKEDQYKTVVLPVQADGTLGKQGQSEVEDVLGGSVSAPDPSGVPRIGVKNATGSKSDAEAARVALVNAGYTVVDSGTAATAGSSSVTYGDEKDKEQAGEVAKTLGLPGSAVRKGTVSGTDVAVVLGGDFTPPEGTADAPAEKGGTQG